MSVGTLRRAQRGILCPRRGTLINLFKEADGRSLAHSNFLSGNTNVSGSSPGGEALVMSLVDRRLKWLS